MSDYRVYVCLPFKRAGNQASTPHFVRITHYQSDPDFSFGEGQIVQVNNARLFWSDITGEPRGPKFSFEAMVVQCPPKTVEAGGVSLSVVLEVADKELLPQMVGALEELGHGQVVH